jgi:hypothetical protein
MDANLHLFNMPPWGDLPNLPWQTENQTITNAAGLVICTFDSTKNPAWKEQAEMICLFVNNSTLFYSALRQMNEEGLNK